MGMTLIPARPSKAAPRSAEGVALPCDYNWGDWSWLVKQLEKWGVDRSSFSFVNDGERIPAATCRQVADAIDAHLSELDQERRKWLRRHVKLWRTCGGYRQY